MLLDTNIDLSSRLLSKFSKELNGNEAERYCSASDYMLATEERDLLLFQLFLSFHSFLHVCPNSYSNCILFCRQNLKAKGSPTYTPIPLYFLLLAMQSHRQPDTLGDFKVLMFHLLTLLKPHILSSLRCTAAPQGTLLHHWINLSCQMGLVGCLFRSHRLAARKSNETLNFFLPQKIVASYLCRCIIKSCPMHLKQKQRHWSKDREINFDLQKHLKGGRKKYILQFMCHFSVIFVWYVNP